MQVHQTKNKRKWRNHKRTPLCNNMKYMRLHPSDAYSERGPDHKPDEERNKKTLYPFLNSMPPPRTDRPIHKQQRIQMQKRNMEPQCCIILIVPKHGKTTIPPYPHLVSKSHKTRLLGMHKQMTCLPSFRLVCKRPFHLYGTNYFLYNWHSLIPSGNTLCTFTIPIR